MITIFVTVAILNFFNSYYGHACNSYKVNGQKNLPHSLLPFMGVFSCIINLN